MRAGWISRRAPMIAVAGACAMLPPVAAADGETQLTISVYDYAGVDRSMLAHAGRVVMATFAAAGVAAEWVERCTPVTCLAQDERKVPPSGYVAELTVSILPDGGTPEVHAEPVMGSAPRGSFFAYAYFGRIRTFAFERNLFLGTVLGHVIAHEVGHLLLREGHASRGIMRAVWTSADLTAMQQDAFGFTADQGERIRTEVTRLHARGAAYAVSRAETVKD